MSKQKEYKNLVEPSRPRIYVTFTQEAPGAPLDAQGASKPDEVTFGPYFSVEIADGEMHADAAVDDSTSICLATNADGFWRVTGRLEKHGLSRAWARFHTTPPQPKENDIGSSRGRGGR
jgi:hypothetical protein